MPDNDPVATIREALVVYNFEYDPEHLDRHMGNEGFNIADVVAAVVEGDVIERTPERNRWHSVKMCRDCASCPASAHVGCM